MAQADVTLSLLVDSNPETLAAFTKLSEVFTAAHPDITFDIETRPGGAEGDNIVKTLLDLANQANVPDSFKTVVTADGKVYGVPFGPAMGGGIFYNRAIYADLGLSVPKTWAEFMANNEKVKAAGKVAVAQTYKDTWTSQLFVLADNYNTMAAVPDWPTQYTDNKAKYATTPAALRGFEHLEDVFNAGYLNADFGAATFEDGMRMVALGEAAHCPPGCRGCRAL